MAVETRYRDVVREIALDSHGYVSTGAASRAGVPPVELPKLAARGGLENIAYGLYRVTDIPATPNDQYAEALYRVGEGAHLFGESVLALFGLADVNPRRIKVATRRRARATLPSFIELVHVKDDAHVTVYDGFASQSVADAILDCRGRVQENRLQLAASQARAEGLLTTAELKRVRKAFSP